MTTTIPTTSTTVDPTSALPLLQRTYHTVNNGVPAWIFALVFVMLMLTVFAMALALSRNPR